MNKYKRLLGDTVIFSVGSLGSKLILFFLVPLYTSCLSTEQYGTAELIDTFANLIIPFVSLVIFDGVLRFTLDKNTDNRSVILNTFIIFGGGAVLTLLITPLLNLYGGIKGYGWFVSLYVIFHMLSQISMTYIKAKERSRQYVILGISQTALLALLNIVLLLVFKLNIYGYLLSNIIAHFVISVIAIIVAGIIPDLKNAKFDKRLFADMVKYSAPLIINNVSWWIIQSSNKLIIEGLLTTAAVGLFSVAGKIPALINTVTSFFSQAWTISATKEYDSTQDKSFYSQTFKVYTFAIFLFTSALLIIVKPFMYFYVAAEYFSAWKLVPALLAAAAFSAISGYFGSIYGALKKSVNTMLSTLFSAVVNIGLSLLLVPRIGLMGAALASAVSYIFIAIYRMADTQRFLKFEIGAVTFIIQSVAVTVSAVCATELKYGFVISFICMLAVIAVNIKNIRPLISKLLSVLKRGKTNESNRRK